MIKTNLKQKKQTEGYMKWTRQNKGIILKEESLWQNITKRKEPEQAKTQNTIKAQPKTKTNTTK